MNIDKLISIQTENSLFKLIETDFLYFKQRVLQYLNTIETLIQQILINSLRQFSCSYEFSKYDNHQLDAFLQEFRLSQVRQVNKNIPQFKVYNTDALKYRRTVLLKKYDETLKSFPDWNDLQQAMYNWSPERHIQVLVTQKICKLFRPEKTQSFWALALLKPSNLTIAKKITLKIIKAKNAILGIIDPGLAQQIQYQLKDQDGPIYISQCHYLRSSKGKEKTALDISDTNNITIAIQNRTLIIENLDDNTQVQTDVDADISAWVFFVGLRTNGDRIECL